MNYASSLDSSAQVFALDKQVATLEVRLKRLDQSTTAHINALEATIMTLQAQHTARVQRLESKVQSLEAQLKDLKDHPDTPYEAISIHNIPDSLPGKSKPLLPKYRQDCIKGRQCSKTSCPFTHPRQPAYFNDALNELPEYYMASE